jgi:hypothetical protein
MKKPVEELTEKPAAKPATKTERNKVIPATPRTIDPTRGLWSKVAQGGNFNKSEFTEVGHQGKPIKQPIHSNEKTKVPGPQHTAEDDRRLIFKRDSKITATTNKDRQLISAINRALAYSGAPEHIRLYAVSTNRRGTLTALSSPKAPAKVFMVERVKDIVLKAARLIDSSIYDLDENNTWTHIKVHNIPLEHYFWRGSLGQLKEEIQAENSGIIIPGPVRWIKSVKAIGDELDKGAIKHSSIVLNIKDNVVVQKMLKHGIRIAGKSHQVEIYVREGLDSQCHLCNEWGHTQNKCTKTEPTCGICAEKHATSAHLCRVGGCPSKRGIICRRHEIFKCSNCSGAHPAGASGCTYARRARQAARDAKKEHAGREETNESVENEFDKMSVVSFEIVEEDVMEGGSASDGNTNIQQETQPSDNCSSTDVLEAAPTTNGPWRRWRRELN